MLAAILRTSSPDRAVRFLAGAVPLWIREVGLTGLPATLDKRRLAGLAE
jgi:hypothetical protein